MLNTTVSRNVPSARRLSRRSTPSRVAPSLAIAACERSLTASVWILTRPKPQSNACPSSSLVSGFTCVPHQREPYIVQPGCTASLTISTSPRDEPPTTLPGSPGRPSPVSRTVYAARPAPRAATASATIAGPEVECLRVGQGRV
jgi:hypothetical protein